MSEALIAFLAARLDEFEEWARKAGEFGERVLREVEADRELLAAWDRAKRSVADAHSLGYEGGLEAAATYRAAVYSDHRDYRQEWKP